MSDEEKFEDIEETQDEVEGAEQEAAEEEEELEKEEEKTESGEESVEEELEGDVTKGYMIENAEKKEEKILEILQDEEKIAKKVIENIEFQLEGEEHEEEEIRDIQSDIDEELKDAFERLQKGTRKIKYNSRKSGEIIDAALEEIRDAAEKFGKLDDEEIELLEELQGTEKLEYNLEEATAELLEELEIDNREIKGLMISAEKANLPEDVDELEHIQNTTMEEFLDHWKQEEVEEEKIDQAIQKRIKEAGQIIEGDKTLWEEFEEILEFLEEIEEELEKNGGPEGLYEEIVDTRKALRDLLDKEKGKIRSLKDKLGGLKNHVPSGPDEEGSGESSGNATRATVAAAAIIAGIYFLGPMFL